MEDIIAALSSILSHKMRSILTMLGIIIGIGAIIAIFSIIEGNTENTKRQLIGGSNNTINIVFNKKVVLTLNFQTSQMLKNQTIFLLWLKKSLAKYSKSKASKMP